MRICSKAGGGVGRNESGISGRGLTADAPPLLDPAEEAVLRGAGSPIDADM